MQFASLLLIAYTKPRCAFNRTSFISSCRACRPMRIALRIRLPTPCSVKTKSPYSCRYLCQIFTDFQNSFSVWFSNKFADYYPTTPRICRHTTPWNINTRKQAINDKLQVRVVTYIRFGDANKQFKKYLFLSLSEEILKISWEKTELPPWVWTSVSFLEHGVFHIGAESEYVLQCYCSCHIRS